MREILFRGKPVFDDEYCGISKIWTDCCDNGFVYGSLIIHKNEYYICASKAGKELKGCINNSTFLMVNVLPDTIAQYTGLNDKNGKRIFEGDICEVTLFDANGSDTQYLCKVEFIHGAFWFVGVQNSDVFISFLDIPDTESDVEILSNTYNNPELLEEK